LVTNQEFEFGSLKESIAILNYNRERNIRFTSAILPLIDPNKAQEAVKSFRKLIFPEDSLSDALYVKKAKEMMKKLLHTEIVIKPIGGSMKG